MHSNIYREGVTEYTIDQAAEQMGISKHTLRYYEREGLLPAIARHPVGTDGTPMTTSAGSSFSSCFVAPECRSAR